MYQTAAQKGGGLFLCQKGVPMVSQLFLSLDAGALLGVLSLAAALLFSLAQCCIGLAKKRS